MFTNWEKRWLRFSFKLQFIPLCILFVIIISCQLSNMSRNYEKRHERYELFNVNILVASKEQIQKAIGDYECVLEETLEGGLKEKYEISKMIGKEGFMTILYTQEGKFAEATFDIILNEKNWNHENISLQKEEFTNYLKSKSEMVDTNNSNLSIIALKSTLDLHAVAVCLTNRSEIKNYEKDVKAYKLSLIKEQRQKQLDF